MLLLHFDPERIAFECDSGADRSVDLCRISARCLQCFPRNTYRAVRRREIEITVRGHEDCLLLLRIETVSSSFRELLRFERLENCVAEIRLRGNDRSR